MHARRILSLLAPVLLAGLALTLLFVLLPASEHPALAAQPAADAPPSPAAPSPLQPRWLELVRTAPGNAPRAPDNGFTLNLNLTLESLAGFAPTLQEVAARVLRGGEQIAQGAALPVPDPSGNFYVLNLAWESYPCPPDYCYPNGLEPGDQVWVAQGSATISMTVPVLTARAEPLADTLSGEAPASAALTAILMPYADPSALQTFALSADPGGHYLLDLQPSLDLHRQDSGYVLVETAPGRRAYRYFVAPLLRAQVGASAFSGLIAPYTDVEVTHTASTGQVLSIYHSNSNDKGEFEFIGWYDPDLLRLQFNPGDQLIAQAAGQIFSMTIPTLTAASDLASQQVSGGAAPGASLEARRYTGPLYPFYLQDIWNDTPAQAVSITASPGGAYSAALALQSGDYVGVFQTLANENQAYARSATPAIHALMNSPTSGHGGTSLVIQGQIDQVFTPLIVTVQGPSGYFKDWRAIGAGSNGAFYFNSDYLALETGDILRVASPAGEEIVHTLPPLTAQADVESATVFGSAPPGSRLVVDVYNAYHPSLPPVLAGSLSLDGGGDGEPVASQVVTASASGEYLADFSADWEFSANYTEGQVTLEDPLGYRASRTWSASGCPPRLLGAQVLGNRLIISGDSSCSDAYLRLRDSKGAVKAETQLFYYTPDEKGGWQVDLFDAQEGNPVRIVTGDKIELSYLGEVATSVVPKLSVQVDKATSLVSGQAPAGARLSIGLKRADDTTLQEIAVVTATQTGAFQADLSGEYAYQTGDRLIATLSVGEVAFYAVAVPPAMRVQLYNTNVDGWLSPLTPFSLSYTRAITTPQIDGVSDTEGKFYAGLHDANWYPLFLAPGDQLDLTAAGQTYNLVMPDLTANLDRQAARLSGKAPPGAHLRATISDSDENSYAQITVPITASAQGEYSLDFPQLLPLGNTYGTLAYLHPAGHQVNLDFSTPRWHVNLDTNCVGGVLPVSGAPAQVTLTKPDGWVETVDLPTEYWSASQFSACFSRVVQSGDLLELRDNQGNQLSFLVPVLEARHDYLRQALIGKATPGNTVKVVFETRHTQVTRTPWLEPDGSFGIDTSDLQLLMGPGNGGAVHMTDAQGNEVSRFFQITGVQVFLPIAPRTE